MGLLATWIVTAFALWLASQVVPGVRVKSFLAALGASAVYGIASFLIGWLIFGVIAVFTLGIGLLLAFLTRLVVSAILLKLTDALTDAIEIRGFMPAFLTAVLISLAGTIANWLF